MTPEKKEMLFVPTQEEIKNAELIAEHILKQIELQPMEMQVFIHTMLGQKISTKFHINRIEIDIASKE
jgi:hypothetical protein